MVLDPKHFDDMDDFCDFDEKLEHSEGDLGESHPNQALSWRRVIIEKAVNNVKKAQENKADIKNSYKKGALVFDDKANKFGRVAESKPGSLTIALVAGGIVVHQDVRPLDFVRDNQRRLTLPQIAEKLNISEVEVIALLNKIELEKEEKPAALPKLNKPKIIAKPTPTKASVRVNVAAKKTPAAAKPKMKVSAQTKATPAMVKKPAAGKAVKKKVLKDLSVSFTKLLPKGATTDPVMDPNGYIQQNFLLMSNRELATATGLSEHTIRRKLGEWNLKRKDYLNKA